MMMNHEQRGAWSGTVSSSPAPLPWRLTSQKCKLPAPPLQKKKKKSADPPPQLTANSVEAHIQDTEVQKSSSQEKVHTVQQPKIDSRRLFVKLSMLQTLCLSFSPSVLLSSRLHEPPGQMTGWETALEKEIARER